MQSSQEVPIIQQRKKDDLKATGRTKLVLTGGGTSGHVNPALAMGQAFADRLGEAEIVYYGIRGRAEEVIVPKEGLPLVHVPSAPWASPRRPLAFARFLVGLGAGLAKAAWLLLRNKPDYVIATGGYAAAPTVLAQAGLNKLHLARGRIVIHEANSVLGKLNRLMARQADHLFLTFPSREAAASSDRTRVVGYPVRTTVTPVDRQTARAGLNLDLDPRTRVVLVFGGSQGARTINRAVVEALEHLNDPERPVFILHGTGLGGSEHHPWEETTAYLEELYGPGWSERFTGIYRPEVYFHNMALAYGAADLVICRAGAGAIHEISALGKPTILIPKPNLPGDHQVQNARTMAARGAAEIVYEDLLVRNGRLTPGLDGARLATAIRDTVFDEGRLGELSDRATRFMSSQAARLIARHVLDPDGGELKPPDSPAPIPPPTHTGLLTLLGAARRKAPAAYDPTTVIPDPAELAYYRQRSALLLVNPTWQVRNIGVKLIGLLRDVERLEQLVLVMTDPTPAGKWERVFGGDYVQVGFIRRNAFDSLIQVDHLTPTVEKVLLDGLLDPYYEARSHAAAAIGHFAGRLTAPGPFQDRLIETLEDASFEVVASAALALGRVGRDQRAVEALVGLGMHRYWQVRRAALTGLAELYQRGVAPDGEMLRAELTGFVTTATDFTPRFALKAAFQETLTTINRPSGRSEPNPGRDGDQQGGDA